MKKREVLGVATIIGGFIFGHELGRFSEGYKRREQFRSSTEQMSNLVKYKEGVVDDTLEVTKVLCNELTDLKELLNKRDEEIEGLVELLKQLKE